MTIFPICTCQINTCRETRRNNYHYRGEIRSGLELHWPRSEGLPAFQWRFQFAFRSAQDLPRANLNPHPFPTTRWIKQSVWPDEISLFQHHTQSLCYWTARGAQTTEELVWGTCTGYFINVIKRHGSMKRVDYHNHHLQHPASKRR